MDVDHYGGLAVMVMGGGWLIYLTRYLVREGGRELGDSKLRNLLRQLPLVRCPEEIQPWFFPGAGLRGFVLGSSRRVLG